MRQIRLFPVLFGALLASSCQSPSPKPAAERAPSSLATLDPERLEALYGELLGLTRLSGQETRLQARLNAPESGPVNASGAKEVLTAGAGGGKGAEAAKLAEHAARAEALKKETLEILRKTNAGGSPERMALDFDEPWARREEDFTLRWLEPYRYAGAEPTRVFQISAESARDYQLTLKNQVFSWRNPKYKFQREKRPSLRATLSCSAPFKLDRGVGARREYPTGTASFAWYDDDERHAPVKLTFTRNLGACTLDLRDSRRPAEKFGLRLVPESERLGDLTRLARRVEVCQLPDPKRLAGPERFFMTRDFDSMTCPEEIPNYLSLGEPYDGLAAKIQALTGTPLTYAQIDAQDPFMKLDFSRAPKLDLIVVSYLVFRADFYGTLLAQALQWHAERGAQVRIMVSGIRITLDKDRDLLYELVAKNDNIKLHEYKFTPGLKVSPREYLSKIHRTNHIKIFATYSRSNPEANLVVLGGRNIHDGFVFKTSPDHSEHPRVVNYPVDDSFVHWRDYESIVRDTAFTERIISHFFTLWYREPDGFARSINMNMNVPQEADPSWFRGDRIRVRHFISLPYKDNHALKDFFADLIDSAEKKVKISTPYFRPTQQVADALNRAVKRGVDVQLVTRLDLEGDTADIILSDVNKDGVNQFLDKIKIYEYTEPKVILHSKLVLIDDRMSFIGSVNLNKRSFYHDTENGLLIHSKPVYDEINALYDRYVSEKSREISMKQRIHLWKRVIINLFDKEL